MSEILTIVPKGLLIIFGIVLLFLIWWLPFRIERLRQHGEGSCSAVFGAGAVSVKEALEKASLTLTSAFSILSAVLVALVALPSQSSKNPLSTILITIALITFSIGLVYALYLSLIRPLSGTAPTTKDVYLLSRILFIGLGLTMFALASII